MTPMQELVVHCELCLGLRRREVATLQMDHIHQGGWNLDVVGKGSMGGKPRRLPFHSDTDRVLDRYLQYRAEIVAEARSRMRTREVTVPDRLLVYRRGCKILPYNADSCSGLDKAVKESLNWVLSFTIKNHTLRRTFGCEMYRAGVDLLTISQIYGHESINQTIRYLGLNMDDMTVGMRRSPFSK